MLVNRSVPSATVIPVLAYDEVGPASDWLCDRFGFRERLRIGDHRAQLTYGVGAVIIRSGAEPGSPPPDSVLVRVEDAAAHHDHASRRGARIVEPLTDHVFGERQYTAEDLAGRRWTFSQSIADVDPADWGGHRPGP